MIHDIQNNVLGGLLICSYLVDTDLASEYYASRIKEKPKSQVKSKRTFRAIEGWNESDENVQFILEFMKILFKPVKFEFERLGGCL